MRRAIRRGPRARHIVPWLAMPRTRHGSGLGRWRWVVERTFAWLNQFRRTERLSVAVPFSFVGPGVAPLESTSPHALVRWHAPRFIRDSLRPRSRRDGRGLRGHRPAARTQDRPEGTPGRVRRRSDRAARFESEARAIAALNHPNIVTVHSVETLDGLPVLTMELVEGRTLADLIPKQGLALDKFLQIAVPLADAISAAHEKGITHRDLKPTNVMVTPEGRVKVLDFGLAKLRGDTTAAQLAGDPTRELTTAGHIVGTVAYMPPEQAEARAVDDRSDIFSLGIVLYEMATGQRPFKGDANVSVLASIVRDTPRPIADVRPDLPSDLVKIVRKALAKDPERRYQSAKDLRNDLDIVREDAASGELALPAQAAPTRGNRAARVWFAAAAVLGALATAVFLRTRLAEPHSGASVEATFTQLTFQPGMERFPSLSPDGKWIVYSAAGEGDEDIYLQSVGGQNAIDLTKDSRASDTQPVFSPDGERIAFRSEREGAGCSSWAGPARRCGGSRAAASPPLGPRTGGRSGIPQRIRPSRRTREEDSANSGSSMSPPARPERFR
jgi:protein kinase-like protein/WD40 repeat protein